MIKEFLKTSAKLTIIGGIAGFSYWLGYDLGEKIYKKITEKRREAEIEKIKKEIQECIEMIVARDMGKYQINYEVYKEEE